MQKKSVFMLTLVCSLILFSSIVIAACANDDQIILRLSSPSNAHGATYDKTSHTTQVCYDEFYSTYSGDPPRTGCEAQNNLIFLSSAENAHAATTSGGAYTTPICHLGLECAARASACNEDEAIILSLSGTSNAHIAKGNVAGYDTKICCRESLKFLSAGWTKTDPVGVY